MAIAQIIAMMLDDGHASAQQVTITSKNFNAADKNGLSRPQQDESLRPAGQSRLRRRHARRVGHVAGGTGAGRLLPDDRGTVPALRRHEEEAVRQAIEMVNQDPALVFPNNALKVFCAETADLSLGYQYFINGYEQAAITLGKTAVQAAGNPNTKTVAEEVSAYYSPTFTVDSLDQRICTTALHEMGHVFHQSKKIQHLEYLHHASSARRRELAGPGGHRRDLSDRTDGGDLQPAEARRFQSGADRAAVVRLCQAHAARGRRSAATTRITAGLNEVVAEVFSALMMGSPVGNYYGVDTNLLNVQARQRGGHDDLRRAPGAGAGRGREAHPGHVRPPRTRCCNLLGRN